MFVIALIAVVLDATQPPVPQLVASVSPVPVSVSAGFAAVPDRTDALAHIESARKALSLGQFDVARREFVIAAALDRDAGVLPEDATHGLVQVLYSQSYSREAAMTINTLVSEAETKGAADVEARALVDAIWLNIDIGQRNAARMQAQRLQSLLKDGRLSASTLALVRARYK